ncbi:PKD domain-containing protein [Kangiella koreensis]|uniref:Putative lipoprotein n=1 Tax=Kangiella koreensis (strain DSM 16069 / JCM 12317 / KCTC 12182 / SW-125) TaxID=523791 RepID=C7R8E6_KANKD|nr:PKD domain-containing protein [Kangiella koreensis]ACV27711.1 putative lipoprotein [Kangiella koreensis DSM 16069]
MKIIRGTLIITLLALLAACGGGSDGDSDNQTPTNQSPSASAGADITVSEGELVELNGSGTDSDGTISSYSWSQINGTNVTLSSTNTAATSFTAPATNSSLQITLRLTVTDDDGASDSDDVVITVNTENAPETVTVSGKVTYDNVPHNTSTNGLDYNNTTKDPVRGATIQALQGNSVIASSKTDNNGNYSFNLPSLTDVRIRVRAELTKSGSPSWNTRVVDNTNSKALYVLDSAIFSTGASNQTLNLNAASGWGGSSYTSTRAAAPFHILDRVYETIIKLEAVDGSINLPTLSINWSVNNIPQSGDRTQGQIGTSFYSNGEIYLLGAENTDTDEYDGHVIIHEWGHYFEDNLARSDSIGGSHSGGDRLDMRVAFGEGFGNAWAGIVTDDPFYRDSLGSNQSQGFSINVENNNVSNKGWFNESSVQAILYDIYDGLTDDTANLGLAPIYEVLINEQKNTEAFTSIFSFITYLKDNNPGQTTQINSLVNEQNIVTNMDIWGSNELNNGGNTNNLPVYVTISPNNSAVEVCTNTTNGSDRNKLGNHRFLRLNISTSGSYTLRLTPNAANDVDAYIYSRGSLIAFNQDGGTGVVNVTTNLQSGIYVVDTLAYDSGGTNIAAACYDAQLISN